MNREWHIGDFAYYIQDHGFIHFCDLPVNIAINWINNCLKNQITNEDFRKQNKGFYIIGVSHGEWLAIVNWDGIYSLYVQNGE